MTFLARFSKHQSIFDFFKEQRTAAALLLSRRLCTEPQHVKEEEPCDFRVLKVTPPSRKRKVKSARRSNRSYLKEIVLRPESDWSNIWVGPKSFNPYLVPMPIRQGYNEKGETPSKYGNAELMKIPNFLHLTPGAVEKHCEALKKFCTKWPKELETDEDIHRHFPVSVVASDYCNSLPSIRDPLARIIAIKIPLKDLNLGKHAKDKFLRLVKDRYDSKSGLVTITTDNCPLRKQNYDHAMYILTALCFESWRVEDWEECKTDEDMEEYVFLKRKAKENIECYFEYNKKNVPNLDAIAEITESCIMDGESSVKVQKLKSATLSLLGLQEYNVS